MLSLTSNSFRISLSTHSFLKSVRRVKASKIGFTVMRVCVMRIRIERILLRNYFIIFNLNFILWLVRIISCFLLILTLLRLAILICSFLGIYSCIVISSIWSLRSLWKPMSSFRLLFKVRQVLVKC